MHSHEECQLEFYKCDASIRIKCVLDRFREILSDKNEKSSAILEQQAKELIHKIPAQCVYSNVKLMNDFYHIKYNHSTNDDMKKFKEFYTYLCDCENTLMCDITHCISAKRYFNRRHQISFMSQHDSDEKEEANLFTLNLLCRIHTYFIHEYDELQLTDHEHKYIVNKIKYMHTETAFHGIDCDKMGSVLKTNGIDINSNVWQIVFDKNRYDMKHLLADLCDIFTNKTDNNTLLASMVDDALRVCNNDAQTQKQQDIYNILLCGGFIAKHDLDHHNFINILKISAFQMNPKLNLAEIEQIASDKLLNGQIYIKNTAEFMNSVQFGALFESINDWNKKQWCKIYIKIKQWTSSSSKPITMNKVMKQNNKPQIIISDAKAPEINKQSCITGDNIDNKYDDEVQIEEMDEGTDIHSIQTFCTLTNCTKEIALQFLQKTSWNIDVAIDRYFRFNGNIVAMDSDLQTETHTATALVNNEEKKRAEDDLIYIDGVEFWYWNAGKENKRYVVPKYDNLKDEILNFKHTSIIVWNNLNEECQLLIDVDEIKQIVGNGNNAEIYGINSGDSISVKHLLSIKLYTDCTSLCSMFCKALRFRKISENQYERISSLMHRNRNIANWARLLIESVQSFGKLRATKKKYFRGIESEILFNHFRLCFTIKYYC